MADQIKQVDGSHSPQMGAGYAAKCQTAPANSCKMGTAPAPKALPWKLNGVPAIKHT